MRTLLGTLFVVVFAVAVLGCGGDDRSQAERDAEVQKTIQDAAQKERQLYEGMQKGVEEWRRRLLKIKARNRSQVEATSVFSLFHQKREDSGRA